MDKNRRNRLDLNTPSELAIYNAMGEVEKIGADERLTNALIKLKDAKELVANFVDDIRVSQPSDVSDAELLKLCFDRFSESNLKPEYIAFRAIRHYINGTL